MLGKLGKLWKKKLEKIAGFLAYVKVLLLRRANCTSWLWKGGGTLGGSPNVKNTRKQGISGKMMSKCENTRENRGFPEK